MLNAQKISFGEGRYYVPSYSGAEKVQILKLVDPFTALVQSTKKPESKPFARRLEYIYNDHDAALRGRRAWEASVRKGKRKR